MPTSNEIYEKVREILVDALGADESECTMDATLMGDLGAESIDFLDIVFRLEKTFNVKIPRGELFPDNIGASDPSLAKDGVLTTAGVAELQEASALRRRRQVRQRPQDREHFRPVHGRHDRQIHGSEACRGKLRITHAVVLDRPVRRICAG